MKMTKKEKLDFLKTKIEEIEKVGEVASDSLLRKLGVLASAILVLMEE